jgi:transposase-like protein
MCPSCPAPLRGRIAVVDREPGVTNHTWACDRCHREFTENLTQQRLSPPWRLAHRDAS